MCLGQGADLHMAQLISCLSKSRLVLPFWCQLTQVVPDKIQEDRKTVCVCLFDSTSFCSSESSRHLVLVWLQN